MSDSFSWLNTDLEDFQNLLGEGDLKEIPVDLDTFLTDPYYLGGLGIKKISDPQRKLIEGISQIYYRETLIDIHGEEKAQELWDLTVHEIVAMCGKGSMDKDSRVWVPELGYKKISHLVDTDIDFTVDSPFGNVSASTRAWKEDSGQMLKITTKTGVVQRVYLDHKFFALTGVPRKEYLRRNIGGAKLEWTEAQKLEEGNWLPIVLNWTEPTSPVDISAEEARWVGYMLGDGSWQTSSSGIHQPNLTNTTAEVQEDFTKIVRNFDGEIRFSKSGYGCDKLNVLGGGFLDLIRKLDICYSAGESKPWSEALYNLDRQNSIELIRGLLATDGYILIKKNRSPDIGIDLTSKDIIIGLQSLLHRLGIISTVYMKKTKLKEHHRDVWRLVVRNSQGVTRLLDLLGDWIPGKFDKVQAARECLNNLSGGQGSITIEADEYGEYYLDKIVSIEEDGYDDFYTITVDSSSSYMAGSTWHHNSGKDFSCRVAFAYTVYKLACLRDCIQYYNKSHGTYIDLLNIAVNADQAMNVFFQPLKNIMTRSPYFKELGLNLRKKEIGFDMVPIRIFSGNSEAEAWEGLDLLLVVLDEIAAFKATLNTTPILTPNGWKKTGDIQENDYVIGLDGGPTKVVGVFPQGPREVFEVEFEDGARVLCSDDHYWTVREYSDGRRQSIKTLTIKDFKSLELNGKWNQKRYAIPVVDAVEFAPQDPLEIDPYVMGILISEGSLSISRRVTWSSGDDFIINQMFTRSGYDIAHDKGVHYRFRNCKQLISDIEMFGLSGVKSETKFIPEPYLYASIEDRKLLLQGLMDGDGTPARGHGSYTTVSTRLKDDIVELCRGLGGIPTATKHKAWYRDEEGNKIECQDKWMICPRVPFNPFKLPRKAEKWKPHKRTLWRSIVGVRSLGYEEDMTCIKVANEDGLYVINDYVVTHNTDAQFKGMAQGAQRLSASAIYRMSKASVMSRFPEMGKCILISFPRYQGDFIMQRYEQSAFEPNVLRIKAKTFEMNPHVTRKQLDPEYRRNPIDAKARFECEPPLMVDAFFRDPQRVRENFKGIWRMIDEGTEDEKLVIFENPDLNPLTEEGTFKEWFKPTDELARFIHVDLGLKRDRAALAMCYCPGKRNIETVTGFESLPVVKMELIKYWEAEPGKEIDFADVRKTIILLCKKFFVELVTFDQWQSADMIQILKRKGINADVYSVRNQEYDNLSTCFYDGRFTGYFNKLLVDEELLKLQIQPNGKIDHPDDGSKDLADAVAGAAQHACNYADLDNEIEIEFLGESSDDDYDWETFETEGAIEEDRVARDGRAKRITPMTTDDEEFEFELEML